MTEMLDARRKSLKEMVVNAQKLDLCFLLDAVQSMHDSIDMMKNKVAAITSGINAAYPDCNLSVFFVLYRGDPNSAICANSGDDTAEDVFTGLERVARLGWRALNRLLVHICDAPCHGTQFHVLRGDGDDKYASLLLQLHDDCLVTHYCFCHLNESTNKMMQKFKKMVGKDRWIVEAHIGDIKSIPEKVVAMSRNTISKALSNLAAGIDNDANQFAAESVVQTQPDWESIVILDGLHYKPKRYNLEELLRKIDNRELFEMEEESVRVQIGKDPFTAGATTRWPYHALLLRPNQANMARVVKRFKVPLVGDVSLANSADKYITHMEVQMVAAHMANGFNEVAGLTGGKKVDFTPVSTLHVDKVYSMEQYFDRNWIKYSSNAGYVDTAQYTATLQAFAHWTHQRSKGMLMVTDGSGFVKRGRKSKNYTLWLSDSTIHCLDLMRFGISNFGEEGFKLFYNSHSCNDLCLRLGLTVPTGYH